MSAVVRYLAGALALSLATGALARLAAPALGLWSSFAMVLPLAAGVGLAGAQGLVPKAPLAVLVWVGWALAASLTWVAGLSIPGTVALQTALLWGARCLWWGHRPLLAAAEAVIAAGALGAFLWALAETASPVLAVWCWALTHALSLCLPRARSGPPKGDRWARARRTAEGALARLGS